MGFDLTNFDYPTLEADYVTYLVEQEAVDACQYFSRLWNYFRNPIAPAAGIAADALNASSRPYFQAQEAGLPTRITGVNRLGIGAEGVADIHRKEVVIENDIAWRIQTMVEFLFGKPVSIRSLARDRFTADAIEAVIKALLEANGGQTFLQDLALMGCVYGFADVVLRTPPDWLAGVRPSPSPSPSPASPTPVPPREDGPAGPLSAARTVPQDPAPSRSQAAARRAASLARRLALEIVEAPRVLPILDEDDFRTVRYWIQTYRKQTARLDDRPQPFQSFGWGGRRDLAPRTIEVAEIIGPRWWQRYEDRALLAEGANILGRPPVVHIQNCSLPGCYEGLSDVEPMLPLQDELNTRLSDRSCRVTYQSFKMYLAKGIDDFLDRPVGPGQMWSTHNMDASIQEFGNDSGSPSEQAHIEDIRQAMDKTSGVTGLAAGLVRGNVGNLTSATALKVLLSGLLTKTERKRITYGRGIAEIVEMVLVLMDRTGVLRTDPDDRRIEIHWPSPLPEDETQRLSNAQVKLSLGVPAPRVLAELGYDRQTLDPTNEDPQIQS